VSELFRHRDRHSLTRATLRNPDRIAGRFDSGWCVESILEYGDACLVAIYGESRDLTAAILREEELTVRCAHAIRPFYRLVDPDIDRCSRFARGIDGYAIKLVEDHVVHIEHAIEECNPIDAPERRMLQIKLRCRGARRQPKDSARDSIRNIESLIRSNFEIVADITVSWQVPADLRRASCEIEASQRGMPLGRSSVWYRR
jgi:hypothetical protein